MSNVHVKYSGQSHDIDFDDLFPSDRLAAIGIAEGAEVTPSSVSQENVKTAVAQHFDVAFEEFADHFVEVNPNGNITVRPQATYGE